MFSNIRQCFQVIKDHSKTIKMHFWMIWRAKNEVFGHFHMFGQLDRLDIVDCDRTKCSPTLCKVNRSWMIIQKPQKLVYDWSKEPKMRFLVIFINLVWWIDLILQIVIEVNVFKHSARLTDHERSFKYHKNVFWNDPNSQKWRLWPFSAVCSVGTTWYCIIMY